MRISDWSSDVCSSDLAGELVQRTGGFDEIPSRDVVPEGGVGVHQPALQHQPRHAARLPEDLRIQALGDDFGDGTHHETGAEEAVELEILVLLVEQRRVEQQRRSEEHTSELQSLMRNLYAVFCLTK